MSGWAACLRVLVIAAGTASLGCAATRSTSADRRPASTSGRAASAPRRPAALPPYPVREELDVVYGHGGGEELHLDLYVPRDVPGPFPAVVFVHGGGWATGSRAEQRPMARALAEQGYVTATVEYRFAPRHKFPAQIQDVKCAVRWLRSNAARCQIDPDRVGALGISAGAHLALLLALTEPRDGLEGDGGHPEQSSAVQAVININGPTDLTRPGWPAASEALIVELMGGGREQMPDAYRAASPVAYVHRDAPPVLTLHGTQDQLVPYEQAKLLHAALRKARVSSRLETMHGRDHGTNWTWDDIQHTVALVREFLDKNLRRR